MTGKMLPTYSGARFTLFGPISFCYIDGNHTHEGVKQDFLNCDRWIESGGFILFDDSSLAAYPKLSQA